jgi:aminotransferase
LNGVLFKGGKLVINLFQPLLGDDELNAIQNVFKSNWIGKGLLVKEFEESFAIQLNSKVENFLSTTSCTEAIFLSAKIFNFSENDEIIVPTISFPSIGSAIIERGASMVFCDVDPYTLNVTAKNIEKVISDKTKAVYITHYGGFPCDMDDIIKLCKKYKVTIIEDAACAVRSFYKGRACGTMGDMGMWSFDAMKALSTGDGGMMYFKDINVRRVAEESLYLGLPIKAKSGLDSSGASESNWWEFEMIGFGRRAIMNNITASIGLVQIKKLDDFLKRREEIFSRYTNELKNIGDLRLPEKPHFDFKSSYYFFWIQTKSRDKLAKFLLTKGIYTTFRYWPLDKVSLFFDKLTNKAIYPGSDYAAKYTLNIPLHQSLSEEEVTYIIGCIKLFYSDENS